MCGIIGFVVAEGAAHFTEVLPAYAVNGLIALQHRGTKSSGLAGSSGIKNSSFETITGNGQARDVFNDINISSLIGCHVLIGHNGCSAEEDSNCSQPIVRYTSSGTIAVSLDGQLVNSAKLRRELLQSGNGLSTNCDAELIAQIIAKTVGYKEYGESGDISKEMVIAMSAMSMSFSLLVMTSDRFYSVRDPFGNRPLAVGSILDSKGQTVGYCAASETSGLPPSSRFEFEVRPGEIVELSPKGIRSVFQIKPASPLAICVFEYVYFARCDSFLEGQEVYSVRERFGRSLAEESHTDGDVVTSIPDSSTPAAIGYSKQSGTRYRQCLLKNTYAERTKFKVTQGDSVAQRKFSVLRNNVMEQRIILVDDSITRGRTIKTIISMLRNAGAREIHLRIASPPVRHPCHMGINIPNSNELFTYKKNINELADELRADSVKFLSIEGFLKALRGDLPDMGHCTACFTGNYPIPIEF